MPSPQQLPASDRDQSESPAQAARDMAIKVLDFII